jgi:chromatin segregation and condensation protein Rec8/ScpA/Scc1 (kleisin family)
MYFRFGAAVVLAVLVAVAGIAIEKRCLMLRRALTREHYRYEVLRDLYARQRLQTQQLGAPARLFEALESDRREMIARKPPGSRRQQVASEPGDSTRQ